MDDGDTTALLDATFVYMLPMTAHSSASMASSASITALDNRQGITRLTVHISEANVPSNRTSTTTSTTTKPVVEPSRWKTNEFRFYGVCFALVVPFLIWWPIRLSSSTHPNYPRFQHKLSQGWIPGRKIDISDPQYRTFRQNIPSLILLSGTYLACSHAHRCYLNLAERRRSSSSVDSDRNGLTGEKMNASERAKQRARFIAAFSIGMLLVLHGVNAFKILLIIWLNHWMLRYLSSSSSSSASPSIFSGTRLGRGGARTEPTLTGAGQSPKRQWAIPLGVWILNCGVLWLNDWFDGYPFGRMMDGLGFLDRYTGLLPRWHVLFNVTMLRLISFGMDYHSALSLAQPRPGSRSDASGREIVELDSTLSNNDVDADPLLVYGRDTSPTRSATLGPAPPTGYKARVRTSLPLEEYNLTNLVAYALYPPLYNAGPIMTFNDFVWQLQHPLPLPSRSTLTYALRFLASLLTMELVLHFMYVVAIKDTNAWEGDTPADLSMIGLWNLIVVWLKLLLPWRFFRLWALMDSMDPPENMVRCVLNNYSTLGFWKSWHRSYNLWVVRYVYIPVGGDRNVIPATLLVFTFVALWHDLSFRLLAWGWLVSLFVIPELTARALLPTDKYSPKWWYRHVCAVGAVFNIVMMMSANLVGFVIGLDGVKHLLRQLVASREGLYFSAFAFVCLFIHSQVMMEYRATEIRQGITRRC